MYRGRFPLGNDVPLLLLTRNAAGAAVVPDAPPTLDVWSSSGKVKTLLLPVLDRYGTTGLFAFKLFLDGTYAAGLYTAEYRWQASGYQGLDHDNFEVIPGGDGGGTVLALYHYERPHARFLVQELTSGALVRGRNPTV